MPLVFASRASYLDDIDLIRPDNMQAAQMSPSILSAAGTSASPGSADKARR
jgi:hypothetical protein